MAALTDEYWMSYLRNDKAAAVKELAHARKIQSNAKYWVHIAEQEQEEVRCALLHCDEECQTRLSPFLDIPGAHQIIYSLLVSERIKANNDESAALKQFELRMKTDVELQQRFEDILEDLETNGQSLQTAYNDTKQKAAESVTAQVAQDRIQARKQRTWRDVPENELAERLSKGEIIPREEWIPGISKGGRKLNPAELKSHLAFAEQLRQEGNNAFTAQNYVLASTRYAQGVHLLDWVEGETPEVTENLQNLLLVFLKNQAAAAIHTEDYRVALKASEKALDIDAYDEKAMLRHAQASIALGELKEAKDYLMRMMRSPYVTTEGHTSARQSLREIRKILSQWRVNTQELIKTATHHNIFAENRPVGTELALPDPKYNNCFARPTPQPSSSHVFNKQIQPPLTLSSTMLTEDKLLDLLEDVVRILMTKKVQEDSYQIHRQSDFDESRVLIRLKKYLPNLLGPLLLEHEVQGLTCDERKKNFDSSILYWQSHSSQVKSITETCVHLLLGDIATDSNLLVLNDTDCIEIK